jgi:hypothetical protein
MAKKLYRTETAMWRHRYRALYLGTMIVLALATIVILGLLVLLRTPLFRVTSVRIEGTTYIPVDQVDTLLKGRVTGSSWVKNFLGNRNILIWPAEVKASDLKYLPEAQSITIQKSYFHRSIVVIVHERDREGIWCFKQASPATCFWFDGQGMVVRAPSTEGELVLAVNDYARSGIAYGEPPLASDLFQNLFSIFEALKKMAVVPKEIRLNDLGLQEIQVPTYNGPTLAFSLRFPATNTPAAFKELATKTAIANLQYIDFRVENRLYYK